MSLSGLFCKSSLCEHHLGKTSSMVVVIAVVVVEAAAVVVAVVVTAISRPSIFKSDLSG